MCGRYSSLLGDAATPLYMCVNVGKCVCDIVYIHTIHRYILISSICTVCHPIFLHKPNKVAMMTHYLR